MTYVTESNIPFSEAFLMTDRFVILNMLSQGVWLADTKHSKWQEIKNTAMDIAKTFGDTKALQALENQ